MSKNRNIFISHRWDYEGAYNTIKEWIENAQYYTFSDYSVTEDKAIPKMPVDDLKKELKERIGHCSVFIAPTGMYMNSKWIEFEINTAVEMEKPILAVIPRSQERNAKIVTDNADKIVGWTQKSVIDGIKELTK